MLVLITSCGTKLSKLAQHRLLARLGEVCTVGALGEPSPLSMECHVHPSRLAALEQIIEESHDVKAFNLSNLKEV